jgi:hypothetical protein
MGISRKPPDTAQGFAMKRRYTSKHLRRNRISLSSVHHHHHHIIITITITIIIIIIVVVVVVV